MLTFLKDLKSTRGLLSPVFSEVLQNFRTRRNLRYFGSQGFHQQLHLEASLSPLCTLSVGERLNPPEEGGDSSGPIHAGQADCSENSCRWTPINPVREHASPVLFF